MASSDPFDLQRFVTAQAPVYATALRELREGYKRGHWMWYIFPQMKGLGYSQTAHMYGIVSLDEARAYLDHALLGPRLQQCTQAVINARAASLGDIFGSPDDMKFRSSMTLFALAAPELELFRAAIARWCEGRMDDRTLGLAAQFATGV